jgi:hypothetical protein
MDIDSLGITGDAVTAVAVSGADAAGCVLLLKDVDTMILLAGGVYFQLVRAE